MIQIIHSKYLYNLNIICKVFTGKKNFDFVNGENMLDVSSYPMSVILKHSKLNYTQQVGESQYLTKASNFITNFVINAFANEV